MIMMLKRYRPRRREGAAALELALMLPLFLLLLIGILELGRAVMIVQIMTSSSREACRQAIIDGANEAQIKSIAHDYLNSAGISSGVVQIRNKDGVETALDEIGPLEKVTLHLEVPYDENSLMKIWFVGRTLVTEVSMRRERVSQDE